MERVACWQVDKIMQNQIFAMKYWLCPFNLEVVSEYEARYWEGIIGTQGGTGIYALNTFITLVP